MKRPIQLFGLAVLALLVVACASDKTGRRMTFDPLVPRPGLIITEGADDENTFVPLDSLKAKVEMIDSMAKVSLTQHYKNPLSKPVTLSYIFPMDERAAITEFTAEFSDGRKLVGIMKEKEQAKQEYDEAVEAGNSAVLMEQFAEDIFRVDIGNLAKNKEVTITVSYITNVPLESRNEYRFTLPTLVGPSYKASTPEPTADSKSGASYKMQFELSARMASPIANASSPSHELKTRVGPLPSQIHVTTDGLVDGDFVILIKVHESGPNEKSNVIFEKQPTVKEHGVYLNIKSSDFLGSPTSTQTAPADDGNTELIFVVDVSGSMVGGKMEDTIKAMKEALTQLWEQERTELRFNILPFSTEFQSLFETPEALTEDTYEQAIAFIDSMRAGGGTELLAPLKHIFEQTTTARRRVIILTDGLIGNNKEVFDLVKEQSKLNTAVFSIGIGAGVSHSLVNGLASHGSGVAEYVILGEKVAEKVSRQLARATSTGNAETLKIAFLDKNGRAVTSGVTQSPSDLPPLYSESDVRVFAIVPPHVVAVNIQGAPSTRTVRFDLATAPTVNSNIIRTMAAKYRIRELELALAASKDASEETTVDVKQLEKDIVSLAKTFNLMSSLTSFVAVDPTTKTDEKAVPVGIPVMHERGVPHSKMRMMTASVLPLREAASTVETDMAFVINFDEMAKESGIEGHGTSLLENKDEEPIDPVIQEKVESGGNGTLDPELEFGGNIPQDNPDDDDFFLADFLRLVFAHMQRWFGIMYRRLFESGEDS